MSYVRDAERFENGLPSIRRSGLIEPVSRRDLRTMTEFDDRFGRVPLTGSYGDPASYQRTQLNELQEQMHLMREEMCKKDRLISQLSTVESPRGLKFYDSAKIEEAYLPDRVMPLATARGENAALKAKLEGFQSQSRELQIQLESRDGKIRDLKQQLETTRENEAKQNALLGTLRARLAEVEAQLGSYDGSVQRSEVAVNSLQRDNKEKQDRLFELEGKLRIFKDEAEKAEHDRAMIERRFNEMMSQLSATVSVGSPIAMGSVESVMCRVQEVCQENAMFRGKMASMRDYLTNAELETKASRETIMRLVSESEREQKMSSKYNMEFETMRAERDQAMLRHRELERELTLQRERLEASERAWATTRAELEGRHTVQSQQEHRFRDMDGQLRSVTQAFTCFKDQLAGLLSDSFHSIEPFEEAIRERVSTLVRGNTDKRTHIEMLESKMSNMTEQLQSQCGFQQGSEQRARGAEAELRRMEELVRRSESELAAGDALRDGLRVDKERHLRFLEQISTALQMDQIHADVGLDGSHEAILARISQVVHKDGRDMQEKKTHIYNLQRKVKSLKEQLDSKDLHMELLRKKLASLEERMSGRSELDREKDEEFVKNRKLLKLVEKYKRELNECRLEIRDLKARLLESTEYRGQTVEQNRQLEELEAKVGQLETIRTKQAGKIKGLETELDSRIGHLSEKRDAAHHTVQSLTSELRTTKQAMQDITTRERQLLELRQVVARMLGLDINTLAIPDYEIIARLEKLILANQSNAATVVAFDTVVGDMDESFRAGYTSASRALGPARASRTRSRGVRTAPHPAVLRTRARSLSPNHKRDSRVY